MKNIRRLMKNICPAKSKISGYPFVNYKEEVLKGSG
jgi:hypothetical protein